MDPDAFRRLIPHRTPMVLIDAVAEYGPERIRARRSVRAGDPFVDAEGLDPSALLEVIAQTIAAGDAMYAQAKGGRVKRGYLTGLTGVKLLGRAAVGDVIEVTGNCLKRMDGMGLFDIVAKVGERKIAQGRYKLFVDIDYESA